MRTLKTAVLQTSARAEAYKRLQSILVARLTTLLEFLRLFPNRIHQLCPKRGQEAMFRSKARWIEKGEKTTNYFLA